MKFIVLLMVVAACIASSVALQCYSCISPADANCVVADSTIAKKDCDEPGSFEKMVGLSNVCMTVVFEVKEIKQVTRSCAKSGGAVNPCSVVGAVSKHCSVCDKDLCNGSSPVALNNMWMTLIPTIITVALIKFSF